MTSCRQQNRAAGRTHETAVELSRLGGPPSHGCVRLHPSQVAALFSLVERNGPRHTRIEISN
jgi:lipoprotein-anchoring transpeptidase ErfK/SrfK